MTYQPSSWDLEPFQEKHGLLVETLRGVEVQAGDLLRFNRGLYSHWAVYIGMNHLCCAQHAQCGCSYIPSQHEAGVIHFSGIGSDIDQSANVVCLPLIQVKSHWDAEVANLWDGEYTPSPLNDILGRAALVIGTDFGGYNLVSNNCEHFASWLRYGVKLCKQVDTAVFNSGLAVAGMVVAGPVGAILAAGFFGNFQENQTQDAEPSSGVGLGDWHDIPIESGTAARHPEVDSVLHKDDDSCHSFEESTELNREISLDESSKAVAGIALEIAGLGFGLLGLGIEGLLDLGIRVAERHHSRPSSESNSDGTNEQDQEQQMSSRSEDTD
mmetsp:Transcript_8616/g.16318  ORF Transcript_8616/g.16318 Transcript_8616/m.16318 type:complete len:326 (+) Transcript_8616:584-1561(+)